ncbi:MAG TPA: MltA domain-containing protein, partial [Planctomycetota bacterium]
SQDYFPYGPITHEHMRASLVRFEELLESSESADAFRQALVDEFEVWMARGRDNSGEVLFTGYCTPIFPGSLERTERFRHPLYTLPPDLVKGDGGAILGRRTADDAIVPYYTRGELRRNHHLDGTELVWLENAFDVYTAHVQGSAIIDLTSGERMEVGYAGKNGHEYQSIGLKLVEEGKLGKDELSLTRLQQYFRDHPGEEGPALDVNPSFVFFRRTGGGPFGSLGQKVTAERSLATDKSVFPRAGIVYAEVRLPDFNPAGKLVQRPFRFFALDQDTGGAIRSAGRCDVYLGTGDQAVSRAGHVFSVGRMYYLFLRTDLAR